MLDADRTGGTSRRSGKSPVFLFQDFSDRLRQLGFDASDGEAARYLLECVGMQRLSPYIGVLCSQDAPDECKTLGCLCDLLKLDAAVRRVVLGAVNVIEIQLKAQYAQAMHEAHGAYCLADEGHFKHKADYRAAIRAIKQELRRQGKHNAAIRRCISLGWEHVPIWVAIDVCSLGTVSRLLSNTRSSSVTNKVAASFGVNKRCMVSWIKTVTLVRNACAHFSPYVVRKQIPSVPKPLFGVEEDNAKPLYVLLVIERLLRGRVEAGIVSARADLEAFQEEAADILGGFAVRYPGLAKLLHVPQSYVNIFDKRNFGSRSICACEAGPHYAIVSLAA